MTLATKFKLSSSNNQAQHNANSSKQECADCGSSNIQWASLNHGVLMCDECCLAHRSLGRCISVIKSLKKSYWPQSLIDTLYDLIRTNSNQIWEANLSMQKGVKKPTAKDNYANKLNYIKMKYEGLAFLSRGKYSSIDELNQQLLNSVKTSNYETTLRILSLGADANYRNQEDGLTCLQTAIQHEQLGQIELLALYGADFTSLTTSGQSIHDLASKTNNQLLCERLFELQFELTDELSYFLCNKRPDHKTGKHFLLSNPESTDNNTASVEELCINTKYKLQQLSDDLFEELCKDIYDEMDRRQIESIWKCTVNANLANEAIPFLMIKSCFTQTRNQLRQKLARFSSAEFSALLVELIREVECRHNKMFCDRDEGSKNKNLRKANEVINEEVAESEHGLLNDEQENQNEDDDDPLYDKVPSDEDYASVASESSQNNSMPNTPIEKYVNSSLNAHKTNAEFNLTLTCSPSSAQQQHHSQGSQQIQTIHDFYSSPNKSKISPAFSSSKDSSLTSSNGSKLTSKILTTNFDKAPSNMSSANTSLNNQQANTSAQSANFLVANAESALNSIINNLNQLDYKQSPVHSSQNQYHLQQQQQQQQQHFLELKNENELMQSLIERLMEENAQLRAEKMLLNSSINTNNLQKLYQEPTSPQRETDAYLYSTVKNNKKTSASNNFQHQKQDSNQFVGHYAQPHLHYETHNQMTAKINRFDDDSFEIVETIVQDEQNEGNHMKLKVNLNYKQANQLSNAYTNMPTTKQISMPINANNMDFRMESLNCNSATSPIQSNHHKHLNVPHSKSLTHNLGQTPEEANQMREESQETMPSKDEVIKKMKKITKAVQELFKATKESQFFKLEELAHKVNQSVQEMIVLFPTNLDSNSIVHNLNLLEETCKKLIQIINKYGKQVSAFSEDESMSGSLTDDQLSEKLSVKNMIVSNMVTYSYEIAQTVKRIVCIMGADC